MQLSGRKAYYRVRVHVLTLQRPAASRSRSALRHPAQRARRIAPAFAAGRPWCRRGVARRRGAPVLPAGPAHRAVQKINYDLARRSPGQGGGAGGRESAPCPPRSGRGPATPEDGTTARRERSSATARRRHAAGYSGANNFLRYVGTRRPPLTSAATRGDRRPALPPPPRSPVRASYTFWNGLGFDDDEQERRSYLATGLRPSEPGMARVPGVTRDTVPMRSGDWGHRPAKQRREAEQKYEADLALASRSRGTLDTPARPRRAFREAQARPPLTHEVRRPDARFRAR